ncbi:iron ABC transporter [Paenibacillus sp. BIHB 4019]|uniref:Iron ABC transporter n=1 Tax=Paenibacillus sp. BIHB 4019 TaxID=1870819 RepID=A0A1B2DEE7_9BACL|nr:iron ABC transporter permease [Paenibacillus sp. BIHB 4019]ANY66070.1 iron ABC transporter [Paenibacillus sp. BIHB 4019]
MSALTAWRNLRKQLNGWTIMTVAGALAALAPSLYILLGLLREPNENWAHIQQYVLLDSALQSLWLVLGAGTCSVLLGVTLAWLVAAYDFPFRRFFHFAFVLPLAIPPYIAAYTYSSMLSYTGSVQSFLRNQLGVTANQAYFDIMSMKGAIFIFTCCLFPYVYLIVKTMLERQSAAFIENARLLGRGPLSIFFTIALPVSQTAIAGGASLVVFEVLNDYGVAKHFGIPTFTTAIFKTWFGMYDVDSALRLSSLLMCAVVGVFVIERFMSRKKAFHTAGSSLRPLARRKLSGLSACAAAGLGVIVFACSFAIPVMQLIVWATWTYREVLNAKFAGLLGNTLLIAAVSITLLMVLAVIIANVSRFSKRSILTIGLTKLIATGYSIPGAVLSISVLALFISLDGRFSGLYERLGLGANKLVLSMSLVMLVFAYVIRFLSVGFNAVEAGFNKVGNRYSEASRALGHGMTRTFFRVDLPMIKGAVLTGFILTFMEIVKELPLTLLLRPFNFETLAAKVYQYASDEQIHQASVPSLFIIAIGLASVCFYYWLGERKET